MNDDTDNSPDMVGFLENMTGMILVRSPREGPIIGSAVQTGLPFTSALLRDSLHRLPDERVVLLWDWVYEYYVNHPAERTSGAASILSSVGLELGVVDDASLSSLMVDTACL